jgi:hypothetical protein
MVPLGLWHHNFFSPPINSRAESCFAVRILRCRRRLAMKSLGFLCLFVILASTLTLAQTNPVPFINQPLVPDATAPGGKGFTLTVNGTGFVSASAVNWNGSALATTFVSGSQLTASVPASDITKAGMAWVVVVNPSPGGGTSNVAFFPIALPIYPIAVSSANYPTGNTPHAIIAGDVNGDSKLDLVTADISDNTVSILLGNGDGTFQKRTPFAASGPVELGIGDFNGDGRIDLAVANQTGGTVSILLGIGDGTFQAAVQYPVGSNAASVTVGDFNGDGTLDLAVTNNIDDTVSILLGKGDGTFQPQVAYPTGARPFPSVTGDFNGDGRLDLAIGNQNGNSVSILLGNGDGTFQKQTTYAAGNQVYSITAADLNGDGKLDLIVANDADNTLSVLLNNGDGTFQKQVTYATGSGPHSVITGDFNGDGKLDLATANEFGNSASILLGNGDGTFQNHVDYTAGSSAHMVVAGDFNGDGRLDLAVVNYNDNTVSVLLQDGTINLSPSSLSFGVQLIGSKSDPRRVVLTNIGTTTLNISSITITGIDTGDFGENNNCGSSLPPKAHCTIRVHFKPSKLGARTAAVTITDDAPGSPQSVPLSGIGVTSGPNATLSTKSLTFATQLVGTTSPAKPVKLSNYGTKTLDISSIVASGDFRKKDDCGSSLPPGGSCRIDVTFSPTRGGHRTGTVTITDNAPDSPQKVSLKGVGTVVKLDPASLDFGTVTIGQKSSPQNTTLTNVGKTRLHITGITITGTDSGDFSQQNDCPDPGYLGGGKSCTITVTFQPTQLGSRTADVSVSDDGGGSPQQVSLSGTGKSQCGGRCNQGRCPTGCRCFFGSCRGAGLPTISGNLDTLWGKETASELLCTARPVVAFACQE